MVIEAAKGGHTQVVKLLLEYPNRMLMNTQQDLPQITANESHLVEVCMMHFTISVKGANSVDTDPTAPKGAVISGSALFPILSACFGCIKNSSVLEQLQ